MISVQTENIGITPGALVASGQVDMSTFELFTKKNLAGQFKQKQTIELEDTNGKKAEFVIQLKYAPKEEPKPEEPKAEEAEPVKEEIKEETKVVE